MKNEYTILITSGTLGQSIPPLIHDNPKLDAIYMFCLNKLTHEQWAKQWPMVKRVFTEITSICDALKQVAQDCYQLEQSFMYTQILKEILLTIDIEQKHSMEFINDWRKQFASNLIKPPDIQQFQREYRCYVSIWWDIHESWLSSIVNQDLCPIDVDTIIRMGFFIGDLHLHTM